MEQALAEFQKFRTPEENRLFTELYNVQRMQSNKLDDVSKVCITTIQRLYAMLQGKEIDPELEEQSGFETFLLHNEPVPVSYNPSLPIETFDFIVTDECHRSIYNLWRQVLEYFDSFIIGLPRRPQSRLSASSTRIWSWNTATNTRWLTVSMSGLRFIALARSSASTDRR